MKGDNPKKLTLVVLMAVIIIALLTLLISCLLSINFIHSEVEFKASASLDQLHYGIVIDCGSSGSRIYVYYWPPHSGNPHDLLNVQQLMDPEGKPVVKKVSPGLSEFASKPADASEHIKQLLLFAKDYIPKEKHKETPLYILATAGMRMIPKEAQDKILKDLQMDITKEFEFAVAENHFEVISGKLEGVYAWIAVNYALNRFSHLDKGPIIDLQLPDGKVHRRSRTVGMIDMGGGSVQIAYEVTDEALLKKIPRELMADFNLGCQETDVEHTYRVYVATFLGYGANSAINSYQEILTRNYTSTTKSTKRSKSIPDPCLPPSMPLKVEGSENDLIGAGNYLQCKAGLEPLVNVSVLCQHDPCSMNGVHQPPIDYANTQFYGFSEFWYTMEDVYRIGGMYEYSKFEKEARDFCSTSWSQLESRYKQNLYPKADAHRFKYECIKSAWMSVMLHKGFQFPVDYSHFQSAQLIEGKDVQWTLGAIVYRTRFLPLRDLEVDNLHTAASPWSKWRMLYNEYLIVICFLVVLAAIFLYMKRLRLCPKGTDLSRVPSMSYFMTDENQMEQGVRYVRGQGYLSL